MRYLAGIFVGCIALFCASTHTLADPIFTSVPPSTDLSLFPGWQRVLTEERSDDQQPMPAPSPGTLVGANTSSGKATGSVLPLQSCVDKTKCGMASWLDFIKTARQLPRGKVLDAVNRWANKHPYVEDWANWGLPDYWEDPKEFLTRGGDCEDFAIIKYFTLRRLGYPASDLRIMIVNDTNLQIYHAVLAVRQTNGEPLILDNQATDVIPASIVSQYHLIYSLNEDGWWLAAPPVFTTADASGTTVVTVAKN